MVNLIRYPGSKAKLSEQIIRMMPCDLWFGMLSKQNPTEYREPFFGAGAVGFELIAQLAPSSRLWLNDKDPWMVALWKTVRDNPEELRQQCYSFLPTADKFYEFKANDGNASVSQEIAAFQKIALHRMSYSGMGYMAGGPIGGKDQSNALYDVGCRWNPENISEQITKAHSCFSAMESVKITCGDFMPLLENTNEDTFIYLDPPYYEKGPELYKHSMSAEDHRRLAEKLLSLKCRWLLSYDDHPEVRRLYDGCKFNDLHVTYTTARAESKKARPKNREVVILPAA